MQGCRLSAIRLPLACRILPAVHSYPEGSEGWSVDQLREKPSYGQAKEALIKSLSNFICILNQCCVINLLKIARTGCIPKSRRPPAIGGGAAHGDKGVRMGNRVDGFRKLKWSIMTPMSTAMGREMPSICRRPGKRGRAGRKWPRATPGIMHKSTHRVR